VNSNALRSQRVALCNAVAAWLLLLPSTALAVGETSGRVTGYVYDPTGSALSEVPVTISGPLLMRPIHRVSRDDGRFEFDDLPPGGGYVLEVTVQGFTPIKETGISVEVGRSSTADVHLTVFTEAQPAETIQMVEKVNPVINPDSTSKVSVVTIEKAATTPIFNQVQAMPELAPGVGSFSTQPSSMGGLNRWGQFYVDGMNTTDVTAGGMSLALDFYSAENFEIITGGFEAQYNSMGMVENTVTKRGGNDFTYDFIGILSPPFLAAQNLTNGGTGGSYQGVLVNSNNALPQTSFYSGILNVGGPLIKDKLWFYVSFQQNYSDRENSLNLPTGFDLRPNITWTTVGRVNLTWQPTSADRVAVSFHIDNNRIDNDLYGFQTEDAEVHIQRNGYLLVGNYDHNFSDNVLFQLTTGLTYNTACFNPEQRQLTPGASSCYDPNNRYPSSVAHMNEGDNFFAQFNADELPSFIAPNQIGNYLYQQKSRFDFDPYLTFKLGSHQLKAGVQFSYTTDSETTGVDGNARYVDDSTSPTGICDPKNPATFGNCFEYQQFFNSQGQQAPFTTTSAVYSTGVFIQDRWTPTRQLTVIPGIRLDWGSINGDPSLNTSSNPNGAHIADLVGVGPRLGITYDLFGNRKSLIVAHYGRSNDVGTNFVAQQLNPTLTMVQSSFNFSSNTFPNCTYANTAAAGATAPSGCLVSGGPNGSFFGKNLTPPHTDELSAGFHQEVWPLTAVGLDFTYDYYGNLWAKQDTNTIWDPSGTQILGYVNPKVQGPIYELYTPSSAYRQYTGFSLWAEGRPGNFDILASYTLSWDWGTVGDYFDTYLTNPRFSQFYTGWVPDDTRHVVKAAISYKFPDEGVDLGLRLRYATGSPVWENYANPANAANYYRSPQGTCFPNNPNTGLPDFNNPNSWIECRNPDQFILDVSVRYNLGLALHIKPKLEITLLVVDVLNNYEAYAVTSRYTPTVFNKFGEATSVQGPLQAEIFLRFRN
jgi:hypothetical protein